MTLSSPFSPQGFRTALGRFATGVTIVTARTADGQLLGLTANSFNSVSLDPALVLWSLGNKSASLDAFLKAEHYAINVLSVAQKNLAERFASKVSERFEGASYTIGLGGAPVFTGNAASFECSNRSRYPEGDHVIFVGEVLRCAWEAEQSPLLYHGGKFFTEHPL
jgi:flavin reductase (DIM6/NTAB) family NADH-FMN oxidoreductase RutF